MSAGKVPPIEEFGDDISNRKKFEISRHPCNEFALQPLDINLKKLLVQVTGQTDTENISRVKIKVVTRDAALHRLADYTPRLKVLILDGSCVDSLRDLGSSLKALQTLSLVRCNLKSLDGVWGFRRLSTLIASNNSIKNPSPCALVHKLARLDLANNEIDDPTSFAFLQSCKRLRILNVAGNLFNNYKNILVTLVPQVRVLDGENVKEDEAVVRTIEGDESLGNESELTSEGEDLMLFPEHENSSSLAAKKSNEEYFSLKKYRTSEYREDFHPHKMGAGDVEANDSIRKEEYDKMVPEERNLESSSSSIYLPVHEFDRISTLDLSAINVGNNYHHHSSETNSNKLSSGRLICGNLAASLRTRNSSKNPFTLPGARVISGAADNNDAKFNSTLIYSSNPESEKDQQTK